MTQDFLNYFNIPFRIPIRRPIPGGYEYALLIQVDDNNILMYLYYNPYSHQVKPISFSIKDATMISSNIICTM